jgi:phage-related holin
MITLNNPMLSNPILTSPAITSLSPDPLPRWPLMLWLGWTLAPAVQWLRTYVFDDEPFLISLTLVVAVDTVLGVWRGLAERSLSSRAFAALFKKVAFYALFLVAVHAVARHQVNGTPNVLLTWLDSVAYSLILVRELLSIIENGAALRLFAPPRWLIERLELFNQTGRFEPRDTDAN